MRILDHNRMAVNAETIPQVDFLLRAARLYRRKLSAFSPRNPALHRVDEYINRLLDLRIDFNELENRALDDSAS